MRPSNSKYAIEQCACIIELFNQIELAVKMHSIRQIEIVRALARRRHFGLAAKELGVSQPALTRSLKQLEAELGVLLFDRQGVTPTLFGEIVLKHGERAVAEFDELAREIALAKGMEIGELRIAAAPYPADISGERAIGILSQRRPNLRIELRTANWTRVTEKVRQGAVDLGFADISEAERDPELEVELVRTSRGAFYCRAAHPLTRQRHLALADLLDYPWVGPSFPARIVAALPQVEKAFGVIDEVENRFYPRILVETFSSAKRIVLAGDAIGAAISSQIERELAERLCAILPVEAPWLSLNYGFIRKRGRTPSPAAKAFMEIVREIEGSPPP
jgi:DNA-binding transcriptional LysR family regulator